MREEANLSQKEVALVLGISQPSYAKWERKDVAITGSQLELLAETLGCDPGDFFSNDEPSRRRGPIGRSQKVFEEISRLPRFRQRDILDITERLIAIHSREELARQKKRAETAAKKEEESKSS